MNGINIITELPSTIEKKVEKELLDTRFNSTRLAGRDIVKVVRETPVNIVLTFLNKESFPDKRTYIEKINNMHMDVSIVGIVEDNIEIDYIRRYGALGVKKVISQDSLGLLEQTIIEIWAKSHSLSEYLDLDKVSSVIRDSLRFIEENYLQIKEVKEICDELNISLSRMSKKFRQYNLVGPKRILMYYKMAHSIKMMSDDSLSIKQIAYLSGFTSEKRYFDCFRKVFQCSPSEYRNQSCSNDSTHQILDLKRK